MSHIAFLCLGTMGYPMAGHLSAAGHELSVYNRTPARAQAWSQEHSGRVFDSAAAACEDADWVMVCTGNDGDLRSVVQSEQGAFAGMREGAALVDHTTASPSLAEELAREAADRGFGFLDAPISGGQAGAEKAALTIMLGGEAELYARAEPILDCYAKKQLLMGPAGSGQLAKMVNQICIAGVVQGLAEGIHFAKRSGLDVARTIEVISQGAAQSWQMDNRAGTMDAGEYDFGFAVDWMRKDLEIALRAARENGARLPMTALVDQFYADLQAQGAGRLDTSSLLKRLEE
jgi:3-hydroxyisobutyrate dehydrogenase-like beta-hydroxyacid dehydrogenase